jgi:hypothetical protein
VHLGCAAWMQAIPVYMCTFPWAIYHRNVRTTMHLHGRVYSPCLFVCLCVCVCVCVSKRFQHSANARTRALRRLLVGSEPAMHGPLRLGGGSGLGCHACHQRYLRQVSVCICVCVCRRMYTRMKDVYAHVFYESKYV